MYPSDFDLLFACLLVLVIVRIVYYSLRLRLKFERLQFHWMCVCVRLSFGSQLIICLPVIVRILYYSLKLKQKFEKFQFHWMYIYFFRPSSCLTTMPFLVFDNYNILVVYCPCNYGHVHGFWV